MQSFSQRFWKKVNKQENGCWMWTGARSTSGYGNFRLGNGHLSSHRASWVIQNGTIPKDMLVLHKCDNKLCVNPYHLWTGTPKDNMQDMIKKGRARYVGGSGNAKLTVEMVKEIRSEYKPYQRGQSVSFSKKYGVSKWTIDQVFYNQTWKKLNNML